MEYFFEFVDDELRLQEGELIWYLKEDIFLKKENRGILLFGVRIWYLKLQDVLEYFRWVY